MKAADANRAIRSCFMLISLVGLQQSRRGNVENRRLCLSAPNNAEFVPECSIVEAVEPEESATLSSPLLCQADGGRPVRPSDHTPTLRGLVQIGLRK